MKKLLCFLSVSLAASGTSALCEAAADAAPVSGGGMGIWRALLQTRDIPKGNGFTIASGWVWLVF